jgi:hypothetical protein
VAPPPRAARLPPLPLWGCKRVRSSVARAGEPAAAFRLTKPALHQESAPTSSNEMDAVARTLDGAAPAQAEAGPTAALCGAAAAHGGEEHALIYSGAPRDMW